MTCCEIVVFASSTTNNQMRGSSFPEGVPPASRKVKTIGRMIKKSNSEELAKRMMASFHAMANIFFIIPFPPLTTAEGRVRELFLHNPLTIEQPYRCTEQHRAHKEQ